MKLMEEHNLSEIDSIGRGYSSAFGSFATDGVRQMVLHFADSLTGSRMREETIQRLHARFYAFLGTFFDDFKSIRLVTLI